MMLLLEPTPFARGLVRKKVDVVNYPDGRFAVQFEGTSLPFRVFDKIQTVQPGAIVENKRLSAVLRRRRPAAPSIQPPSRRNGPFLRSSNPPTRSSPRSDHLKLFYGLNEGADLSF